MSKRTKIWTVVLVTLLVFVFTVFFNLKKDSSITISNRDTNWNVYTDSKFNFEFEYPKTWAIYGREEQRTKFQVLARVVNPERAGRANTDTPIEQFFIKKINYPCSRGTQITLSGEIAFDSEWGLGGMGPIYNRYICFPLGEEGPISISISAYDEESMVIFDQMVSTFKLGRI